MSFDSILDSARKAAEIIQSVADKLKITLPKDFPDQIVQLNNCLDVYSASKTMIAAVVSDARGGFNVESMAKLTANFDTNWDAFAKEYNELFNKSTAEQQTNVLETFARTHFGDNVFTAGSIIKNETPAILGGIVTFKAGINSFKGSYRNPEEAVNKIKTGIDSITAATEKIAGSLNNIAKTIQGGDGATGVALLEKLSKLHEIKLLNVTSNALGGAQHGMAAYGSGKAALGSSMAALGDVKDLLGDIKKGDLKGVISSGKATVDSVKDAIDDVKDTIKSGKKTIESAKATLSGLKGNVSDGQLTGAAANISGTSGASRMAGSRGNAATSRSADTANQGGQDKQDESGKSDSYVCSGAIMQCTFGDRKAKLTVYPDRTVFLTGQPMANISDHQSMYNIAGFGKCHTTRYPATGAATAANHGKLTPMPCVPGTNTEWKNGKDDYIIKGDAALLKSSYCKCRWGGIITITDDGQKDTGAADMSRVAAISMEQMLTETEEKEKQGVKPEAVLDGIQLALDAAGLAPGVGAIPDLLNASISALRGDWGAAGLSVLAAVPAIGDAATAAKFAQKGVKAAKAAKKTGQQITKDQLNSSVANRGLMPTNKTSIGESDLNDYREAKKQKEMQNWNSKSKEKIRVIEGGKQESVSIKKAVGQNDNTIYDSVDKVNGISYNAYSYKTVSSTDSNRVNPVEKVIQPQSNKPVAKGVEKSQKDIMDMRDAQEYKLLMEKSRNFRLTESEMKRLNEILRKYKKK
ncbi:MAG: DUF4280 domain-containing protein [Bacteroidaceae bacterium]|nr:DUF4280 domain-containing protein [Bacteroidaceae bacterium]